MKTLLFSNPPFSTHNQLIKECLKCFIGTNYIFPVSFCSVFFFFSLDVLLVRSALTNQMEKIISNRPNCSEEGRKAWEVFYKQTRNVISGLSLFLKKISLNFLYLFSSEQFFGKSNEVKSNSITWLKANRTSGNSSLFFKCNKSHVLLLLAIHSLFRIERNIRNGG